jgi:hypothetical protein
MGKVLDWLKGLIIEPANSNPVIKASRPNSPFNVQQMFDNANRNASVIAAPSPSPSMGGGSATNSGASTPAPTPQPFPLAPVVVPPPTVNPAPAAIPKPSTPPAPVSPKPATPVSPPPAPSPQHGTPDRTPTDEGGLTSISPLADTQGLVDFETVYKDAGVDSACLSSDQITQMHNDLLRQGMSPPDAPRALKVLLNMKCSEAKTTLEQVFENLAQKVSALDAHAASAAEEEVIYIRSTQAQINTLQAEIDAKRKALRLQIQKQRAVVDLCHAESAHLRELIKLLGFGTSITKSAGIGNTGT